MYQNNFCEKKNYLVHANTKYYKENMNSGYAELLTFSPEKQKLQASKETLWCHEILACSRQLYRKFTDNWRSHNIANATTVCQ